MGCTGPSVSTPAYLGPVTSTYTVRDTEWQSLSISAFCCNGYARRSDCLHQAPFIRHVRLPCTPAEAQGTFSYSSGILGSPSVHHRLHARIKGHIRRHLLQQVLVHRRTGNVPPQS